MQKPTRRKLIVIRKQQITPNMLRITLGGDQMAGFPEGRESANFKLIIPTGSEQPIVRTYTVLKYDAARQEVDVDFVLHGDHGPASNWALHCEPGEPIGFAGPGSAKLVDLTADWFLFAGDMSALPAISANIEKLPPNAKGYAVLEVIEQGDIQALDFPAAMQIQWLVNPDPNSASSLLHDAVVELPWLAGRPAVWVAGESGATRLLRSYFKQQRSLAREDLYTSGYWQIGLTEDKHQQIKRQQIED